MYLDEINTNEFLKEKQRKNNVRLFSQNNCVSTEFQLYYNILYKNK